MLNHVLKHILAFALFLAFFSSEGQTEFQKFSAEELKSDIDTLKATVLATHQNPFTYCSEEDFNLAFELASENILDSLDVYEFSVIVAEALQVLKDSHTYLNFGSLRNKYKKENGRSLPLSFRTINDTLYIIKDKKDSIPIGSQLISINGVLVEELNRSCSKYGISEGLSITGNRRINDAIFSSAVAYSIPILAKNKIVFKQDGSIKTIDYPAELPDPKNKKNKKPSPFGLNINRNVPGGLAVIKIGSFAQQSNRKYLKFLKKAFKIIDQKGIEHLAIDLRGNTGGKINRANTLMGYLKSDYPYIPANIIAKQSKISIARFDKSTNKFTILFLKVLYKKNKNVSNYLKQITMPINSVDTFYFDQVHYKKPLKHQYTGKNSYLLIDGLSGSASVLFSSSFRNIFPESILIGEPCLGPSSGTWGNPAAYQLSNSKLDIYISTLRTNIDNSFEMDPTEITPNHIVNRTIVSYQEKQDPAVQFLEKMIQENHTGNQ